MFYGLVHKLDSLFNSDVHVPAEQLPGFTCSRETVMANRKPRGEHFTPQLISKGGIYEQTEAQGTVVGPQHEIAGVDIECSTSSV